VTDIAFAIKAAAPDTRAETFVFIAEKTMYGGKRIAAGDIIFLFASENDGGRGLIARGIVTAAEVVARKAGVARQTPRVTIAVMRTALTKRRLGRNELSIFRTGMTGGRRRSSISNFTGRQQIRSLVSRKKRRRSLGTSSDEG
jgi:hypothetical protein